MKKTISTVFLLVFCIVVNAQDSSKIQTDNSQKMTTTDTKSCTLHHNSIQLGIGTTGVTLDFRHRFTSLFGIRIGGSYLPGPSDVDATSMVPINKRSKSKMDINSISGTHLLLEISPFSGSGFRLITGVGYFGSLSGKVNSYFVDSVGITNTKKLSPQELGTIKTTIDYGSQVAPYLGIGFGKPVPCHRVGLNVEMGFYYLKPPTVSTITTNSLADNTQLPASLQSQLATYIWWPNIQLNLNVRL